MRAYALPPPTTTSPLFNTKDTTPSASSNPRSTSSSVCEVAPRRIRVASLLSWSFCTNRYHTSFLFSRTTPAWVDSTTSSGVWYIIAPVALLKESSADSGTRRATMMLCFFRWAHTKSFTASRVKTTPPLGNAATKCLALSISVFLPDALYDWNDLTSICTCTLSSFLSASRPVFTNRISS